MTVAGTTAVIEIDPEEQARADLYALLSRLFATAADEQLLQAIALSQSGANELGEEGATGQLGSAWRQLIAAAAATNPQAVSDEYHRLFIGSGRADISLYSGAYTARSNVETPLVALRSFLAVQGLQRQSGVYEPEDHIAMLFEIMRYLIAEQRLAIAGQRQFFERFIWPGGIPLCDAISSHADARFFRDVAMLAKSFLQVEHDAFHM